MATINAAALNDKKMNNKYNKRKIVYTSCLSLLLLFVVTWVAGLLFFKQYTKNLILSYASDEPLVITNQPLEEEEVTQLHQRWNLFTRHALSNAVCHIELTAPEFNTLIATHFDWAFLKDTVHVEFGDGVMHTSFCINLLELGLSTPTTKYLNGVASFSVWGKNGLLVVALESMSIGGKNIPGWLKKHIQKDAMTQWYYEHVERTIFLNRFVSHMKRLSVTPNLLTIEANNFEKTW